MTATNNVSEQELVTHLQGLQNSLADLRKERTLRTAVGAGGFVVIMGVVFAFASNLHSYATDYPADALTRALGYEAEALLGSPETMALGETFRQQAMQTLVPAVTKQVQADVPKFQQEIQAMFRDLDSYLNTEISQRASKQLLKTAQTIHADLMQEYGHLPVADMQKATAAAQAEYVKQLQVVLNAHLQQAAGSVNALQDSLNKLKQDPDYAALQRAMPEQLERNFYSAILELAAHNLKRESLSSMSGSAQQVDSTQSVEKGV